MKPGRFSLAVVAPAGGAVAFLLTRRSRVTGTPDPGLRRWYFTIGAVAVLGTVVTVARYAALHQASPARCSASTWSP